MPQLPYHAGMAQMTYTLTEEQYIDAQALHLSFKPRWFKFLLWFLVVPGLVLLGAGLGKPALAADWPAGTRLFGELGRLYDADWLAAHGWRATLAEVMADKPAARGLSGRGSKKS